MHYLTIIATCLLFVGCSRSVPVGKGPLAVEPPPGWQLERTTTAGLEFYTLKTGSAGEGLLMFSKWPVPSKPDEIPGLLRKLADGFVAQAKKTTKFALSNDIYEVEQFAGPQCSGSYAAFRFKSPNTNTVQAMFMMSVEGEVWNGQFTGKPEQWPQALKLLTTIKRNG
jgi:hypothetical protein